MKSMCVKHQINRRCVYLTKGGNIVSKIKRKIKELHGVGDEPVRGSPNGKRCLSGRSLPEVLTITETTLEQVNR